MRVTTMLFGMGYLKFLSFYFYNCKVEIILRTVIYIQAHSQEQGILVEMIREHCI